MNATDEEICAVCDECPDGACRIPRDRYAPVWCSRLQDALGVSVKQIIEETI